MMNIERLSITGSALKLLAVVSMLVDHIALFLFRHHEAFQEVLFTVGSRDVTPYFLMRAFGRIAFPIFAFLVVEGFVHTRNHFKYGRNLLLFALISEIPWNLLHAGTWHYLGQNVFFTLFLGYLGLCCLKFLNHDSMKKALALLFLLAVSFKLHADYGYRGFGFILMLYVLRETRLLRAVIGCCFLNGGWMLGLAFIPISLYDGRRGFIHGNFLKFCFYAFYPVHLLVLYLLRCFV